MCGLGPAQPNKRLGQSWPNISVFFLSRTGPAQPIGWARIDPAQNPLEQWT
jgi:hypothetical protein